MDNPTLNKALRLLVHPATLAAVAVLLVNDHLLRRLWPSEITGKLGDCAWLFFIPFAVTALAALMWPGASRRKSEIIGAFAFGTVGLVFALAKTIPAAHEGVVRLASAIFGFEVGWRRDPTDLLALLWMLPAAWLWRKTPEPAGRAVSLRSPGWIALSLSMLLTVANGPAPEPGIYCLDARDGELMAYAAYSGYRSTDGGVTWAVLPNAQRGACPNPWSGASGTTVTVVDLDSEQRSYRFTPGQSIERSEDGGASWQTVYTLAQETEAALAITRRTYSSAMLNPAPLDGKVDRATGNAVFAMGHEGALVWQASQGAWREVPVGVFRPRGINGAGDFLALLVGEALLAVALGLLALAVFATRTLVRGKALWIIAVALGWVVWGGILFVFSPALASGYGTAFAYAGLLILGVLLLVTTIISIVGFAQQGRGAVGRAMLMSLVAGLLFLAPFGLWLTNALPRYLLAAAFGTILGVVVVVVGSRWVSAIAPR